MTDAWHDIGDLVAHLKSIHRSGDLYRGQVRDFPVLVPSFVRSFASDLTSAAPIVRLDKEPYAHQDASLQARLRFDAMHQLIRDFGFGLGNIVAQQYGLSSQALDVTDDIDVAAYFATRDYPAYTHHSGPGRGVIYRFRGLTSDGLRDGYSLDELRDHFQDHFPEDPKPTRDSAERFAWSKRFVTNWRSLERAIDETDPNPIRRRSIYLGPYKRPFSWKRTRFEAQSGGLIRPRCHRTADVLEGLRGRVLLPFSHLHHRIVAVENLRANPACEAHLFEHTGRRVTGFYRRELWPEPADDGLYGSLWQMAISKLLDAYGFAQIPAVDDPRHGLLDRGYTLPDEVATRDGRDNGDLYRGQLEDSLENEAHGPPRAIDQLYRVQPLLHVGDVRAATRAVIRGLRLEPENLTLLIASLDCLEARNMPRLEQRVLDKALSLAPTHPVLLYRQAVILTRRGDFPQAIELVDRGTEHYDFETHGLSESPLLELRGVLAWVTGDFAKRGELVSELVQRGETPNVKRQVEWLVAHLPELDPGLLDR